MITIYKINPRHPDSMPHHNDRLIVPVEVDRVTDRSFWKDGKVRRMQNELEEFYPSWEEAHSALHQHAVNNLNKHKRHARLAEAAVERIQELAETHARLGGRS